eukprot:5030328-Prymnesium_polylepis.1
MRYSEGPASGVDCGSGADVAPVPAAEATPAPAAEAVPLAPPSEPFEAKEEDLQRGPAFSLPSFVESTVYNQGR